MSCQTTGRRSDPDHRRSLGRRRRRQAREGDHITCRAPEADPGAKFRRVQYAPSAPYVALHTLNVCAEAKQTQTILNAEHAKSQAADARRWGSRSCTRQPPHARPSARSASGTLLCSRASSSSSRRRRMRCGRPQASEVRRLREGIISLEAGMFFVARACIHPADTLAQSFSSAKKRPMSNRARY
jgi:hypothetical protein